MNDRRGMVVAPQPEAVEAGVEILRAGGNAIDTAIACAMVQTTVDPMMCGIAGFGSLGVYLAGDRTLRYLDFHAPAPARARPDMWAHLIEGEARDGFGFLVKDHVNELGYQSICVPATLRAFHEAHTKFGVLPWPQVIEPAADWAENGWVVRPHVEQVWWSPPWMGHAANRDRVALSSTGRGLYCGADGAPKRVGDWIENPDYAQTLRTIAAEGVESFYDGPIAQKMINDIEANGGLLSADDLTSYQPTWNEPLRGSYRDFRIGTNRPPGGGAMLLEMLNVLEDCDLREAGHNTADYVILVSEAMRQATVDKDRHLADPYFVDVPLDRLVSKRYARDVADRIRSGVRVKVPRLGQPTETADTTHVSVVDADGNCVALTHSLGIASGVITDGLGFIYNACMSVFDPRPGHTHSIAPNKSRFSSIMPSVVFRDGAPYLVIGALGGTQISMGMLQVILNVIEFECSMSEAILMPRFSATSNLIDVVNRIPRAVTAALETQGFAIHRQPESYGIAMVHGIVIHSDGVLEGAADPLGDGMALGAEGVP